MKRFIGKELVDLSTFLNKTLPTTASFSSPNINMSPPIPSWDELFMRDVYLRASKSKDPRTKIGAVLVRDGHDILKGYNGFPKGVQDLPERYEDRVTKYQMVAHAEANAVFMGARFGITTLNSTLYTQGFPCNSCAIALIQGGIKDIVIHYQWPQMDHVEKWVEAVRVSKIMLGEAGISVRVFDKKLNLIGFLDGKEIEV